MPIRGGANFDLLIKAIVVMSIMAIWAITSLFNRESRPAPTRPTGPMPPPPGPRPGEPTMRWSPTPGPPTSGPRRVALGDDDILIISPDPARSARPGPARPIIATGPRRAARTKPPVARPARPPEPPPARARLAGVSQNVSQQIAKSSLGMTPMDTMPSMTGLTSLGLSSVPTAPVHAPTVSISAVATSLADPVRLREAFIINEILQPPLALRGSRPFRR